MTRHKKPLIKLRSFYLWHRYMGLSVMLFALLLAITGLLLNHTASLQLDRKAITSNWLLDWYDIESPQRLISYVADKQAISLVEDQLYFNARAIAGRYDAIAGALAVDGMIVVAADTHILLLTAEGEIVERLTDVDGKAQRILAIGLHASGKLALRSDTAIYLTTSDFAGWQRAGNSENLVSWVTPAIIPPRLQQQVRQDYRSHILSMERIMLDLHSGRFFGEAGVIVVDIAAILFMLLAISGLWMWIQQQRKRAQHRRKR
jgi:hypothetical protein